MYVSHRAQYTTFTSARLLHLPPAVFWEQQGLQTFGHKIQITRPQASQPAFDRHLMQLTEEYGSMHAINLLGSKENEAILSSAYARHLHSAQDAMGDTVGITHFDFHNAVRIGGHESVFREIRHVPESLLCDSSLTVWIQALRERCRPHRQVWLLYD